MSTAAPDIEVRVPLPELIEALSRPEAFGAEGPVEVVQTHVSAVFLTRDHAYKIKKPLNLWGFLDYGTVEVRKHWCEEEVALNRRVAPPIYEGVAAIRRRPDGSIGLEGEGEIVEHAVVMKRLPAGATFQEMLDASTLGEDDIREAAATLAAFHRTYRLAPEEAALARPSSFGGVVRQNVLATREAIGRLFPRVVHEGLARRLARLLRNARGLIRQRVAAGRMVNGHGDVRLEHVVRYDGKVGVIDCVEFSPLIRHVDPLCDMAFLSMDLTEKGRPDLARVFEASYLEHLGESDEVARTLMPLYRAYRAHVRAKVDELTWRSPEVDAAVREQKALGARRFLALAWTYAREGETPPLVLLRGPSGTGKSALAGKLAPWIGAEVVRSDLVRKELFGLGPTERLDAAGKARLYAPEMSARTYETVLGRGLGWMRRGRGPILDATYLRADARAEVRRAALSIGAPFAIVDVTCPPEEVRRRLAARTAAGTDASDADVKVYESQSKETEPLSAVEERVAVSYASGTPVELVVLEILDVLERHGGVGA
ncbi:MAG: AAA family ATPase [Planctomycetota bacterium]